jgi:hypothetical protein
MKLVVSHPKGVTNLKALLEALQEFDHDKTVELLHDHGANFLAWSASEKGITHSVSRAIPEAWLDGSAIRFATGADRTEFCGVCRIV